MKSVRCQLDPNQCRPANYDGFRGWMTGFTQNLGSPQTADRDSPQQPCRGPQLHSEGIQFTMYRSWNETAGKA